MNREHWLNELLKKLRPYFQEKGYSVPDNIKISVGFPSKGVKSKTIGECWDWECSDGKQFEIFIHPNQDAATKVGGILVHEVCHSIVGIAAKHGPEFKECATKMGLVGKMKATEESPELAKALEEMIKEIGPYPHAKLNLPEAEVKESKPGPVKAVCTNLECGYHVRIPKKWVDKGYPTCPCGEEMVAEVKDA